MRLKFDSELSKKNKSDIIPLETPVGVDTGTRRFLKPDFSTVAALLVPL